MPQLPGVQPGQRAVLRDLRLRLHHRLAPAPGRPADRAARRPAVDVHADAASRPEPSAAAPTDTWVAEIWIDPDWYADQESTDPLPSPGLPASYPLKHTSVLIGRASRSRGISPDLDLETDSGISRRHAQLTTDGTRWFVEDLGSSNGTYVGGGLGTLPKTAITPSQKVEVTGDDRIYLGAWTRIVLRKAAPGEFSAERQRLVAMIVEASEATMISTAVKRSSVSQRSRRVSTRP